MLLLAVWRVKIEHILSHGHDIENWIQTTYTNNGLKLYSLACWPSAVISTCLARFISGYILLLNVPILSLSNKPELSISYPANKMPQWVTQKLIKKILYSSGLEKKLKMRYLNVKCTGSDYKSHLVQWGLLPKKWI